MLASVIDAGPPAVRSGCLSRRAAGRPLVRADVPRRLRAVRRAGQNSGTANSAYRLSSPLCPLGLAAGRLGNFINGELWGRPASVPWAMVFPQVDAVPRHPSQLYEFGLEGIVLFVLLWFYARRRRPVGAVSGLFLIGYGSLRFLVEYAREPDNFLGVLALGLSMGQWLSLPMIAIGVGL